MTAPRFPHVSVRMIGEDGNIFAIMGRVVGALRRAGVDEAEIRAFTVEINQSRSYTEALGVVLATVETDAEDR